MEVGMGWRGVVVGAVELGGVGVVGVRLVVVGLGRATTGVEARLPRVGAVWLGPVTVVERATVHGV